MIRMSRERIGAPKTINNKVDLMWSIRKVWIVCLLNPKRSSITKVEYSDTGIVNKERT